MKIWVTFDRAGFHCWPNAPPRREYLTWPHRHLFKVKVTTEVSHEERQIEFHDLLDIAKENFDLGDGTWSCETMARTLGEKLIIRLGQSVTVEVSEDGECGAVVKVSANDLDLRND